MKKYLAEFFAENKYCVILVAVGIVIAILMLTINFWRTLLLCVLAGAGFLIGMLLDRGGVENVKNFFERIIHRVRK